jgi:hypothetical protein
VWGKQYRLPQCFSHFASLNTKLKPWKGGYFFSFSQGHKHLLEIIWGTKIFFSTVEVLKSPFRQKKKELLSIILSSFYF